MTWKQLTAAQIRDEYNINVANQEEINAQYQALSKHIVSKLKGHLDIAYDHGGSRHMLDLFVPDKPNNSPIVVFVHGGYWQVNSKNARRFPADAFLTKGIAWIPINYRLAPSATMDEIVHDGRQAIAWIYQNAKDFNCDPERIYVCGNSAGGHMMGMLAAAGWQQQFDLPDDVIKGGCALSGLFELEPLLQAEANEWLHMDRDTALRNSPIYCLPMQHQKIIITCGTEETNEFRRQSHDYAEAVKKAGIEVNYFEMPGENHFSIIGKLADKNSSLFTCIVEMVNGRSSSANTP